MIENEVKAKICDPSQLRDSLTKIGAIFIGDQTEEDEYLTSADLSSRNQLLRIRTCRRHGHQRTEYFLTYKAGSSEPIKRREELEVSLNDPVRTGLILKRLGLRQYAVVSKQRELYDFRGFRIVLDNVMGLGTYLEIEALLETGNQSGELLGVLGEIGLSQDDIEKRAYSEMMFEKESLEGLSNLARKLSNAGVKWALFAGAAVSASVPARRLTDIDVIVRADDMPKVEDSLGAIRWPTKGKHGTSFGISLPWIDIVDELRVESCTRLYWFGMDDQMEERIADRELLGMKVPCIADEDTIVLKVILQRGPDEGKRDIDDVRDLLKAGKIDMAYLKERLRAFNSLERAKHFQSRWGVDLQC